MEEKLCPTEKKKKRKEMHYGRNTLKQREKAPTSLEPVEGAAQNANGYKYPTN